ncbi:MAG: glutamate formimidoyltransferase [bacterium]|nr:glutamate formimidoyltransferase [bacterium]
MSKIVSAIPNICEGKDQAFIQRLTERLKSIPEVVVLDVSMDATRNRTVFAFTGTQRGLFDGGLILYEEALKHIDMRKHKGQYPRIGAVDVFPFVPLRDVTIEETVEMSKEFARMVAEKFNIAVYLYGESAQYPLRKDVEKIREVQYEGLEERLKDPRWKPDFGPDEFKPDFGATVIGSRYPLVSFNLHLGTPDVVVALNICRAIQYSGGGLRHVTANSGIDYENQLTQIAVSIHNFKMTPLYKVVEMARMEAKRYGVTIDEVEMVGLIPEIVFVDSAMYYMNINNFSYDRLMMKNIQKHLNEKIE